MGNLTPALDLHKISQIAWNLLSRYLSLTMDVERLDFVLSLSPRPGDYSRVFRSEIAELAQSGYEPLWKTPPLWPLRPEQTQLKVAAATVPQLMTESGLAAEFPGGYQEVIMHYRPEIILLCWEFMTPGSHAGLSFDGLVPIDDRWAWFPKPWRILPAHATLVQHWSD